MKWRSVLRARYAFGAYAVAEGCSFAAHQNRVREMERAPRRVPPENLRLSNAAPFARRWRPFPPPDSPQNPKTPWARNFL